MALGAKLNVTFQRRFLAFWNTLDPHNGNPFGLIYFSDFLEFIDTLLLAVKKREKGDDFALRPCTIKQSDQKMLL